MTRTKTGSAEVPSCSSRTLNKNRCDGPTLSVIIPAFNEAATIEALVERVFAAPYEKQIIVVDDGSSDDTLRVLESLQKRFGIEVYAHDINRGKGAAIRTGLLEARGRF